MRHLSEVDLIDLAEGARAAHEFPHLPGCESCRARLSELRMAMTIAADVPVPEPSPLFWEHFSDRVRAAVAAEAEAPAVPGPWSWRWRFVAPAVALAAVILAGVVSVRSPSGGPPERRAVDESPMNVLDNASFVNDPSLSLMADLAADLDLDSVAEAGLTTTSGALDRVVLEMSPDERLELQRILKQEMSRQGA
jgi:hypothetical protein